jgi:hypothetical protein
MGWNGLANINEIEQLGNGDAKVLNEVRSVLEKHGAQGRFGVTLLHSHFDLEPGEVLVEKVDAANRTLKTEPMGAEDIGDGQLVATSWRLDGPGSPVPIIYCYRVGDLHEC